MLLGLIVLLTVGGLFLVLGLLLWKKQRIGLIHAYHTRNVRPEDVPAYTRQMGFGMLSIGAGCVLTGLLVFLFEIMPGWIAFPLGFAVGLALMLRAQKRFNGGCF